MFRLLKDRRVLLSTGVIATLLLIALWPRALPVDSAIVRRGTLTVTVNEEGRTRIRDRFVVSAPVSGRVLRVELEPGDVVRRGDIVARLRPGMTPLLDDRERAEAEAAVRSARAAVGRAEAEQRRAGTALSHAQRELERSRQLLEGGALAPQDIDARQAEARVAAEEDSAAKYAVETASAELEQANARLAAPISQRNASAVAVRAPADGVVLRRLRESEAVVPAGEPLIEIGDPTQLEVIVDLLSTDAARVRPGTRAFVEVWPGQRPMEARVRRIEPAGFTKVSALGVEEQRVNVLLDVAPAYDEETVLGDGYRVDVSVVVLETSAATIVPAMALFREGNRWAVYEVKDGRARRTFVTLGAQTASEAEVLDGLAADARVVLHPGDRIADGSRVNIRNAGATSGTID